MKYLGRHGLNAMVAAALVMGLVMAAGLSRTALAGTINVCGSCTHTTIQGAIDDASPGDTIQIAAGTYSEAVDVHTRVVLDGAGNGTNANADTIIDGTGLNGNGLTLANGSNTTDRMVVRNLRITGFTHGIAVGSYTSIENVTSVGNTDYGLNFAGTAIQDVHIVNSAFNNNSVGLKVSTSTDVTNVTISDSSFDSNSAQGWYIAKSSGNQSDFADVVVLNSTFNDNAQKGMYIEKLSNAVFDNITVDNSGTDLNYGHNNGIDINLKFQNYQDITIKNSVISNSGVQGSASDPLVPAAVAIKARDDGPSYDSPPATLNGVILESVTISGPENALRLGEPGKSNAGPIDAVVLSSMLEGQNNAGDTGYGLINETQSPIDAGSNWWGDLTPNDYISGNVDYSPWLASDSDIASGDPGFQGDFSVLYVDDDSPQTSSNGRIQEAVDLVNGSTINVAAGTYVEDVNIDKPLTVNGAQAGVAVDDGRNGGDASESTVDGQVTLNAADVVIDGFTLTNSDVSPSSITALLVDSAGNNAHILNNIVQNVGNTSLTGTDVQAIYLTNGPDNVAIEKNLVQHIKNGNQSVKGVYLGHTTSSGDASENVVIQNNKITDITTNGTGGGGYGILVNMAPSVDDLQILNNEINIVHGSWTHAIGLEGNTPGAEVIGNRVSELSADNYEAAAIFFEDNPSGGSVVAHFNSFASSVPTGVAIHPKHTNPGYVVNATSNWWGSADGPSSPTAGTVSDPDTGTNANSSGSIVGPNIRFDPWLASENTSETVGDGETVTTTTTDGDIVAVYSGTGIPTITLSEFNSNPGSTGNFDSNGNYYDIHVTGTESGDELEITLPANDISGQLYWFDGNSWEPVLALDPTDPSFGPAPVTPSGTPSVYHFVLNDSTTPNLSELSGTPFTGAAEQIRITPSTTTLAEGETLQVVVDARSAGLYGVDVSMDFNSSLLDVTIIDLGDGLAAETVAENTYDNSASPRGTLDFAYSQRSPSDDVSSPPDIVLATITFRALDTVTNAQQPIKLISALFTDKNGTDTTPGIVGSPIGLTINPSPQVFVDVALQGRSDYDAVSLEMEPVGPGNILYNTGTTTGTLVIEPVPSATYVARVDAPKYLAAEREETIPSGSNTIDLNDDSLFSVLTLLGGDINDDDRINIQDLVLIGVNFGPSGDLTADINGDGNVNIQDLAIAAGNFGAETDNGVSYGTGWPGN